MEIAPGSIRQPLRPVCGLAVIDQYAAETLRIVRVGEFARTRQMEIVKPRNPESQRARAQHPWPGIALLIGEWPHRGVRLQQRLGACGVERGVRIGAPVVYRDPHVVDDTIDAGKIEIDETADVAAVKKHVVAKQVGVNHAARQAFARLPCLKADFRFEQFRVL